MFSLNRFSILNGNSDAASAPVSVPVSSSATDLCRDQPTTTRRNQGPQSSDIASVQIKDLTAALRAINNHPFKKYTIGHIQMGRFPMKQPGSLSRETIQQAVAYVMGYFGHAHVASTSVRRSCHMVLRLSDNSEYLCRELFIALYNGLTCLSDIYQYDDICHWRMIRQVSTSILPQVFPSDFILQDNELICHIIAEFIGAHVFLRCATVSVPIRWNEQENQPSAAPATNDGVPPPPLLFRGPAGRRDDLTADWNESIEYSSSGLDSEEDVVGDRGLALLRSRSRANVGAPIHAVSPPPALSTTGVNGNGGFGYVSPQSLHVVRSGSRSNSVNGFAESSVLRGQENDVDRVRDRAGSRSALSSTSLSPQPSLHRSSSSGGHNFTSTSMHAFGDEGKDGNYDGDDFAGGQSPLHRGRRSASKRTRRHHTFVLANSHGSILRDDIFARNWEEFDVMFWRGVRMCDVSLVVDQNLNLYTRMPHRRMWFMPSSPFAPRSHLSTPYAPLYQYYVKKWHFDPIVPPSPRACPPDIQRRSSQNDQRPQLNHNGAGASLVQRVDTSAHAMGAPVSQLSMHPAQRRVSSFYTLCPDSQGLGSALSYTLPIATQTTHSYLFGNDAIQQDDCRLFSAIDEPSAVFDVQREGEGSGDSSFSCSGSDDFHTALVIEELRAIHPSQINNDDEMSDADREYLYFEDQIDCDNVRVARCCEWNFRCGGQSGRSCDNLFIACCYDSSQPFLIFSSSFPSVRHAKNHMTDCRRLRIPTLGDENDSLYRNDRLMKASKVKFETLSSTRNTMGGCASGDGILIASVQFCNPQPNVEPNSCTTPVFVPGSTQVVVYKFDSNLNVIGTHRIGQSGNGRPCDLSEDVGIVFVLEDMVVTHEFIYVLLSAEPNPHFLGRRLSSNPWMRLPHHDDTVSASSDERSEMGDGGDHVSDEDEEDDCPRFRNVDNRWRAILRTSDLSFVCIEPDRVQFPGATLGCVVPIEMFDN